MLLLFNWVMDMNEYTTELCFIAISRAVWKLSPGYICAKETRVNLKLHLSIQRRMRFKYSFFSARFVGSHAA